MGFCFLILFSISEFLYHLRKWKAESTRKLVHICTGLLSLLFPLVFNNYWSIFILCSGFLGLLYVSKKFNFLNSINAVQRKTKGSSLFPIVVFVCFYIADIYENLMFYCIPLSIMAISDPIASMMGKKKPIKTFTIFGQEKSLGGSLGFFVSTLVLLSIQFFIFDLTFSSALILIIVSIGLISTLAEAFSTFGWDNFSIPLSIIASLILFNF